MRKKMEEKEYFHNIPLLHTWDGGKTWNAGGFDNKQLETLVDLIRNTFRAPRIVETGAGNSTISFLFCQPTEVVSICPEKELFDRITEYCVQRSIPTSPLRAIVGSSEWELPRLA